MKYWLVCITAALSLMALVPFHARGAGHATRAVHGARPSSAANQNTH